MQFFEKYLSYWAPLGGTLLFLLLGLWLWLSGSRAVERGGKSLEWVRKYRKGGFPFAKETLMAPKLPVLTVLPVLLAAGCWAVLYQMNSGYALTHSWTFLLQSRYAISRIILSAFGGAAVFALVWTLFGSPLTAVLGAAIFVTAPRPGYAQACLLALSLLFLLLYLRSGKAGFPSELLYLIGLAFYAMTLALWSGLIWLAPFVILLHWYKLRWYARENRLTGRALAASLIAALLAWAAMVFVCAFLRVFLHGGFWMYTIKDVDTMPELSRILRQLFTAMGQALFKVPQRNLLLDPLIAAPLLGLGFWGIVASLSQLRKRKNVQAGFVLGVFAACALCWLLTGESVLLLPLTLAACFIFRTALAGKKTGLAVAVCALAVLFHAGIAVGAWLLPMNAELQARLR